MAKPKALVVVPSYMREEADLDVTMDALKSVRDTQGDGVDLLVVDDGSPESGLVDGLEERGGELGVTLHRKGENTGFSKTVNVGLSKALEEGRHAILLNADVEISTPAWYREFLAVRDGRMEPAAVVGALLLFPNGTIQHAGIYFSNLTRTFDHLFKYGPANLPEALEQRVCPVTGAFQFIRHETLEKVGLYDEEFFLGWEDVDYCAAFDQKVLTDEGWTRVEEMPESSLRTACGDGRFRDVEWFYVGRKRIWEVCTDEGDVFRVTAGHRWPVMKPPSLTADGSGVRWKTTQELSLGDRLEIVTPAIHVDTVSPEFIEGVQHGFTYGDGFLATDRPQARVDAYPTNVPKQEFIWEWFDKVSQHKDGVVRARCLPVEFKQLPKNQGRDYKLGFVAGYLAADGCSQQGQFTLSCVEQEPLEAVRDILADVGIRVNAPRWFERRGGYAPEGPPYWRMTIGNQNIRANPWLLLRPDQVVPSGLSARRGVAVSRVRETNKTTKVYCCEEPETQSWLIQGSVRTGNCLRVFLAGEQCVFTPRVRAYHFEMLFRGNPSKKVQEWQAKSFYRLAMKYEHQSFAGLVPNL